MIYKFLLISNMYPSDKNKFYGIFVKNMVEGLLKEGDVLKDKVVIDEKDGKMYSKIFRYIKFYIDIVYKILFKKYDFIYVHNITHTAIPLFLVKCFIKTPIILNVHGGDVLTYTKYSEWLLKLAIRNIKKAKAVVVPSEYFKKVFIEKTGCFEDKIIISPSGGINGELFKKLEDKDNLRIKYEVDNDEYVIGYISRIDKNKGWDTYIKSISILKNKLPNIKIKGIIVGDGKEKELMYNLIKKLNLSDSILYLGGKKQEELPEIYNIMDSFVFPTKLPESLGLVGLESMLCGTPVIGAKIGALTEYIESGKNGFLFETNSEEDLSCKIMEYYKLDDKNKKIIINNAINTGKIYEKTNVSRELKRRLNKYLGGEI